MLISAGTLPTRRPLFVDPDPAIAARLPARTTASRSAAETPTGARIGPARHFDMRIDPAPPAGCAASRPVQAVIRGWMRRADGGPLDPYWLLIAGDALPPVTFDLGMSGWVPTVTLDAHLRALPAPGWLIAEQRALLVGDGWLDETCTLWDETGPAGRVGTPARGLPPSPASAPRRSTQPGEEPDAS